ncbi:MFS transporter [Sphingomicrobium sediminis]|uniref:MFS transporter n=1 Tax=Sphingomicrobium sediminis TaxID=2950949 RepID=A0A9X2EGX8_9SPHN|nr:MFS transporter [Sphingomicrobium sediminis]MCM8557805.1 MFS transporter [Sphingomicrobium sediminis]
MNAFERRFVLANFGAFLAFLPLLVLLLPRRVEAISPDAPLILLSQLLLVGGIAASIAHYLAGAWSDRWVARHGERRGLIAIGLTALMGSYALLAVAATPALLFAAIITFQLAFNLMFSPMGVLLADYVPDARKGLMAGALNMALPLAGFGVTALGWISSEDADWPFLLTAFTILLLVMPLLIGWRRHAPAFQEASQRNEDGGLPDLSLLTGDYARAWVARLLVQLGGASLLPYLFLYVDSVARAAPGYGGSTSSAAVGTLTLVANIVAIGAGLAAGRWSDRIGRRKLPLVLAALLAAGALALLAAAPDWRLIILGYALFTAGLTAFLSVDSAMVAQIVSGREKRGALLGLMNLTNTLPAIIAPAMALVIAEAALGGGVLRTLLGIAALAAVASTFLIARIESVR